MDCTHPLWSRTIKQKTTPRNARGGFLRLPMVNGGRRPSGRPGKGSPAASPYSVGVGVVDGVRMGRGCHRLQGAGWNEPSGRPGRACLWCAPTTLGSGVVAGGGWIAVVGGRETADGMKMNPPGGQGRACLWRAPTTLGSGLWLEADGLRLSGVGRRRME